MSAHLHNIIYAWISHNSIVMKMSTENVILRKQVYSKRHV